MSTPLDPVEPGLLCLVIVIDDNRLEVASFSQLIELVRSEMNWGWTEMAHVFRVHPATVRNWAEDVTAKPHGLKDKFDLAKRILIDNGAKIKSYHERDETKATGESPADDD